MTWNEVTGYPSDVCLFQYYCHMFHKTDQMPMVGTAGMSSLKLPNKFNPL